MGNGVGVVAYAEEWNKDTGVVAVHSLVCLERKRRLNNGSRGCRAVLLRIAIDRHRPTRYMRVFVHVI